MLPWQQLSNSATPSFATASLSPQGNLEDTARTMAPLVHDESLFDDIGIIMQRNDVTALCSSWEEQLTPDFMSTDHGCLSHDFAHGGNHNADFEWSAEFLEDLITPISQSSISLGNFSSESSWTIPTTMSAPSRQPSPVYSEVSSVATYQHDSHSPYIHNHLNENHNIVLHLHTSSTNSMHTSCLPSFCEASGTCLANSDTSRLHPSPGYSDASSFAAANQHDPFYMSNNTKDHFRIHVGTHQNGMNSVYTLPNCGHGNVHTTYSGSTASDIEISDDEFVENEATSFVAFANPQSHDQKLAISGMSNLEGRSSQPLTNLGAIANPLHVAASYDMATAEAITNSEDFETTKSGEGVCFLVETSTPAIEDGYVWRKYGQKVIKDKLHPRSYFRCAQPHCPVKKQTESSSDIQGCVLITYFGRHNH